MAVTLAPGSTKPCGAVTVPEISPPTSARRTGIYRKRRSTKRSATKIARGPRQKDDMQHLNSEVASHSKGEANHQTGPWTSRVSFPSSAVRRKLGYI